jgi:hypothetical protein
MIIFLIETVRLKVNTTKSIQFVTLIGWIIFIAASGVGRQMISKRSHKVGVADVVAGLPLVSWSKLGEDLRIAHFFGLHGIQVNPLFALLLSRKWKTNTRHQIRVVAFFGWAYASRIAFMHDQASLGIALMG